MIWYCFDGIPENSVVAIGTVGGSPRKLEDRERFEEGLKELVRRLHPHTIIVYGSANYKCFKELEEQGITILAYPSKTNKAFAGRVKKLVRVIAVCSTVLRGAVSPLVVPIT